MIYIKIFPLFMTNRYQENTEKFSNVEIIRTFFES